MGRLSEYDHVEREALRKGISRQPDPLPRGAVVAGEHVCRTERIVPTGDGFAKCLDCGDDTFPWDSEDGDPAVEGEMEEVASEGTERPCRFCGRGRSAASACHRVIDAGAGLYAVRCWYCGAMGPLHRSKTGAISAWTRRVGRIA